MIGMSREAIKRNAQGNIEYQTRLARAGKDFSAGSFVESTSEIKRIRSISGLSRKDFAERYKIPIRTLEKWERQESKPAEYVVLLLERAVKEDLSVK